MIKTLVSEPTRTSIMVLPYSEQGQSSGRDHLPQDLKRIWTVCLVLAVSLGIVYGTTYAILEHVIVPNKLQLEGSSGEGSDSSAAQQQGENPMTAVSEHAWGMSDTVPFTHMSDEQFTVYVTAVLWATVLITGIGLEVLVWIRFLQPWNSNKDCRDNAEREFWWRFAQFLFPILTLTAVGLSSQRNFLALPILVLSLWKFGFPETIGHFYVAIYHDELSWLVRICDLVNGLGSLTHHSAATIIVCSLLSGISPVTRFILSPALILIMQHWFTLIKYANTPLYLFLVLTWEFWFEWVLLSDLELILVTHWVLALASGVMLFAHWSYLIAGGLYMLTADDFMDDNVHVRAITHFRGYGKGQNATPDTKSDNEETDSTRSVYLPDLAAKV